MQIKNSETRKEPKAPKEPKSAKAPKEPKASKGSGGKKKLISGTYLYDAIDTNGAMQKGSVVATSYAEAKRKVEHQNLNLHRLVLKKPWYTIEIGKVVPLSVLVQAIRQLASFAQAGIPLSKGLEVLVLSTEHKRMAQSLEEVKFEIEGGTTFSEALRHQAKIYPVYFGAIIESAERTGNVSESLGTLNEYLDRDLRSSRAVKSALFYPVVLLGLAVVAITLLSVVVLPRFQVFFDSLNVQLPVTTRALLWTTHFLGTYWWALLALNVSLGSLYLWAKRIPKGRLLIDSAKLHLPILGGLARLVAIERFCRVLATLTKSQVPLPDALAMAGAATGNKVFERDINKAREGVINGEGLYSPLSQSKVFPRVAIQIFKVGEDSGQLDSQLAQAAGFYSDELDFRMKNFTGLIEPIVLLLLGGGIGFVAVALVSAMYGIYSGVEQ